MTKPGDMVPSSRETTVTERKALDASRRLTGRRAVTVQTLRRFVRNPSAMAGLTIVLVMVVLHAGAPLFTRLDPNEIHMREAMRPPGAGHPFGTDNFGRDIFSRALYGGRLSLLISISVTAMTTVTGFAFGALAGFYKRLDNLVCRIMDVIGSIPTMLLALVIVSVLRPSLMNLIIALTVPSSPGPARVVRAVFLSLREQDFVIAARSVGAKDRRIILRHVLPNVVAPILVQQSMAIGAVILAEAGLGFLGVGLPAGTPTLGGIVSLGRGFIRTAPWMSLLGGVSIAVLVIGFNLLGDGLRDTLDPRMK